MAINLRSYRASDQQSVMELDRLALSGLSVSGLPSQFDDLLEISSVYMQNGNFVVADIDNTVVGMGGIRFLDGNTARINRMRVAPQHQRKGIAAAMLCWLEHQATKVGVSRIVLNTLAVQHGAQRLYEAHGYRKMGEGTPDGFAIFMYEKELRAQQ